MAFSLFKPKSSILLLIFLLLLAPLYQSSHGLSADDRRRRMAEDVKARRLFGSRRANQLLNCGELVLQLQCSQHSNCSWCRSQDLDDMCFSKTEAWRLPQQVFSCG